MNARELIEDGEQRAPIIPACAYCDKEHGATYPPGSRVSHGACRRHTKQLYMDLDFSEEEAEAKVAHIEATGKFVPGRPPIEGRAASNLVHYAAGARPEGDLQDRLGFKRP